MMFDHAVTLDNGVFRHLRAVAQGGDSVIVLARNQTRIAINFGTVANPDVIEIVSVENRAIKHLCAVLNKGIIHHGVAVDLRLMYNTGLAHRGVIVNLKDLFVVGRKPFRRDDLAVMKNAGVAINVAFAADSGLLYGDVVTYFCAVADLRGIQPAIAANLSMMADHAGLGETGIIDDCCPGKNHAVFIVYPAVSVLCEGALILDP